ncbi:hypothetical protein M501DRAFT_718965 [Patellaria atrata CBS 101060]|uniref:Uncharacterized protein n=1 Tax=Patellaria atrata CBS 101060 TaxID=1346257 RepID=A0A9P4VQ73_9PEZI|nr:hypothetical protein M501DRAFT_718965 [Patellaria atrata CBS 101060]
MVRRKFWKEGMTGDFMEPGAFMTENDSGTESTGSVVNTATFFSFPYLSFQSTKNLFQSSGGSSQHTRTLLQALYPDEPLQNRDMDLAFRRYDNSEHTDTIFVPQLWVMLIRSGDTYTIFTCSELPLRGHTGLMGVNVKFMPTKPASDQLPVYARVVDADNRQVFLDIMLMPTYSEFADLVASYFGEQFDNFFDHKDLMSESGKVISPRTWPLLLQTQGSRIINILVSLVIFDNVSCSQIFYCSLYHVRHHLYLIY